MVHKVGAGGDRHHASAYPGSSRRGRDRRVANGVRLLSVPHTLPTHHHSPLQTPGCEEQNGTHRCFTYAGGQECESIQVSIAFAI